MGLTQANSDVIDTSKVSVALTNDHTVGGVTEYIDNTKYYYTSPNMYQQVATTGSPSNSLIFDSSGNLYWAIANYYNGTTANLTSYVYKITPNGTITVFASVSTSGAIATKLTFDSSGNLYWAIVSSSNGTTYNNTGYVYKITPSGTLTTFTSQATIGAYGTNLIFDSSGNLYWAISNNYNGTTYNQTSYVYKITPGGTKTTFASQATIGAYGTGLIFDSSGNLYWAISNNYDGTTFIQTSYVYKITPGGTKTTFASQTTDWACSANLVFDGNGDLYWNAGVYIFKITPTGTLTTFMTYVTTGYRNSSLIIDALGNFYCAVVNYNNGSNYNTISNIYKITPNGTKTIFANQVTTGAYDTNIIFDTFGNLYWSVMSYYNGTTYNLNSYLTVRTKQIGI